MRAMRRVAAFVAFLLFAPVDVTVHEFLPARPLPVVLAAQGTIPSGWLGARVRVLDEEAHHRDVPYPSRFVGGDGSCVRTQRGTGEPLVRAEFVGREGVVVEVVEDAPIVRLDGTATEIRVGCGVIEESFVFLGELEVGRALVGRPAWTRGALTVIPFEDFAVRRGRRREMRMPNLERLTITRVEPGFEGMPLVMCVRSESGIEGCIDEKFETMYAYAFDARYHRNYAKRDLAKYLYFSDPRAAHTTWSTATWKSIREEFVKIGMTMEMLRLACGRELLARGTVSLSKPRSGTGLLYSCRGRSDRFVVAGDKVIAVQ